MNAMRQLDSGNGNARIVERLEAGHRSTAPSDRAIVLVNNIVVEARSAQHPAGPRQRRNHQAALPARGHERNRGAKYSTLTRYSTLGNFWRVQVIDYWCARRDSNSRPPGS